MLFLNYAREAGFCTKEEKVLLQIARDMVFHNRLGLLSDDIYLIELCRVICSKCELNKTTFFLKINDDNQNPDW